MAYRYVSILAHGKHFINKNIKILIITKTKEAFYISIFFIKRNGYTLKCHNCKHAAGRTKNQSPSKNIYIELKPGHKNRQPLSIKRQANTG